MPLPSASSSSLSSSSSSPSSSFPPAGRADPRSIVPHSEYRKDVKLARANGDHELTVIQIADPHLGTLMSIERLRNICRSAVQLQPDLVLLTGDFYTCEGVYTPHALYHGLEPLKELSRRGRVYACPGNHDLESDRVISIVQQELAELGITYLVDQRVVLSIPSSPSHPVVIWDNTNQLQQHNNSTSNKSVHDDETDETNDNDSKADNDTHQLTSMRVQPTSRGRQRHEFAVVELIGLDFEWPSDERVRLLGGLLTNTRSMSSPFGDNSPAPSCARYDARIILAHDPHDFITSIPPNINALVLSGHTHGGFIGLISLGCVHTIVGLIARLPDHGLWRRGDNLLYVHRGQGCRFLLTNMIGRIGVRDEHTMLHVRFPPKETHHDDEQCDCTATQYGEINY